MYSNKDLHFTRNALLHYRVKNADYFGAIHDELLPCYRCKVSYSVHRVLEKSLKALEFGEKNSRPLKVLENRVGP